MRFAETDSATRASARRWAARLVLAGAIAGLARHAAAQDTDARAQGTALFNEGRALMAAGKYGEACPKLQAAQRLIMGVGATVNLAECFEKTERIASAYVEYQRAASLSAEKGQADRSKYALDKANALKARVANVVVRLPKGAERPGLEVRRDGLVVPPEAFGTPIPIDRGTYKLEVRAPGHRARRVEFTVARDGETVEVALPALSPEAAAGPAPAATAAPERPAASDAGSAQRIAGFTAGGLGVALLAASAVTGGMALSSRAEEPDCIAAGGELVCSPAGSRAQGEARDLAWASTGTMIAGGALAAAGLVLVLTAPRSASKEGAGAPRGHGVAGSSLQIGARGLAVTVRFQ
jgi:hypothetical protein